MKKLVTLLCAVVLALSMGMVAFASASPSSTSNDAVSAPENVYTPTNEKGEVDTAGKVGVYETVKIPGNENAKVVVVAVSTTVKAAAVQQAAALGLASAPFAYVDVNVEGYTAGTPVTVPFNLVNVVAGDSILVLHQKADGTWETIIPDKVEDGKVTVSFTSLSPVVFVRGTAAPAVASPKTGAEDIVPFAAIILVAAFGVGAIARKRAIR
jgi:hypothetical protein